MVVRAGFPEHGQPGQHVAVNTTGGKAGSGKHGKFPCNSFNKRNNPVYFERQLRPSKVLLAWVLGGTLGWRRKCASDPNAVTIV